MRCLHQLKTKLGYNEFFFDGILTNGRDRVFLQRVPFEVLQLGAYGISSVNVEDSIWLQSKYCEGSDVFYKVGVPAREYRRFHTPFLWVANLAKHFVDFLDSMKQNGTKVSIQHFRGDFKHWLLKVHKDAPKLGDWLAQYPSDDFRTSVVANVSFLYKEFYAMCSHKELGHHVIWAEIWDLTKYPSESDGTANESTIVTDYIYRLFAHLPFGDRLQSIRMSSKTTGLRKKVTGKNGLELASLTSTVDTSVDNFTEQLTRSVKPGDTISTRRDNEDCGSDWKRELPNSFTDVDRWFALVQKICKKDDRNMYYEVLWYYRPADTLCGLMKYPWSNELFLSDHCSCSEKYKIPANEVIGVHNVEFGGDSSTKSEFFCRQVYFSREKKWEALQNTALFCSHMAPSRDHVGRNYQQGDTVLIQSRTESLTSEPCELVSMCMSGKMTRLRCRRLIRRNNFDSTASTFACNELVYSSELFECSVDDIVAECHVRFFEHGTTIPTPYDRKGVGGFFFITHRLSPNGECIPLETFPQSLRQGFDPTVAAPKLRGLDLFCGGGNFGRGLEEGGAITMRWANDINKNAVHTYMANCSQSKLMSPFLGSIDDLQRRAFGGSFSKSVPTVGHVDFISGGSPCPGFSYLTNDKTTEHQRKNQSLVAAFASCVDLYRPKYGLLENVPGIVQNKTNRHQDVLGQLICAIVGMGYQTQFFLTHSSSHGSAQGRPRVFLSFAAPNVKLPNRLHQTHSYPMDTRTMNFGQLSTGSPYAKIEMARAPPFPHATAQQATQDLVKLYDGQPDTCITFPDHRLPTGLTRQLRVRLSLIPNRPWGMNLSMASKATLTPAEMSVFRNVTKGTLASNRTESIYVNSSAFGRMFPNKLMATITTKQTLGDHKNGRQLHWSENRGLSVMEARRAQGFLDDKIILGTPAEQFRIVGNSVAREVALALGLSIRDAWVETCASSPTTETTSHSRRSLKRHSIGDHYDDCRTTNSDDNAVTDLVAATPIIPRKRRRLVCANLSNAVLTKDM
ncbi:DNA methyltransferase Dim-2 [Pochonia chlamydosporia 170]|uniref:DNA (cytosine-5-)-methyltransferase n=1 Tax=Pochonia chlamydosporia 170 TaxID=1380566 RepID=A0A179FKN0_METCM|nr:DNA methyltransferase Dim-2 [Pochonia chlamydosporia 170]OAQ66185.1 DNA methyltransferase Dim-2 [Pochonia chlamydosporia 170]